MTRLGPARAIAAVVATALVWQSGAGAGSTLQRIHLPESRLGEQVTLDIGKLIASGAVEPASAISIDKERERSWVLRTPNGSSDVRWYRNLLNARPGAPDLVIDVGLNGVYDVYAQVRAVHMGGAQGMGAKPEDLFPMAFELALDRGGQRHVVVAAGFPKYHYDTEVLAGYHWQMDGRKIVLRNLNKPVYLYALRFVPSPSSAAPGGVRAPSSVRTVARWLATDHVTIVKEPDKHFAFGGAAELHNGDLVVVYREGSKHGVEQDGKNCLSRSVDGGHTWLPRATLIDRPGDDRGPSVFQMSDGTVIATSNGCMVTSHDSGHTWSKPKPTPVSSPMGAVEDEDGHILYGGQCAVQKAFTQIRGRTAQLLACAAYRSEDKGRSWQEVGVATYTIQMPRPEDFLWQREPSMCVVPGQFYVMCNCNRMVGDGFIRIVRSRDRGKTWGPVVKTRVWGKPAHLLALRDGRLLMTYGYRQYPWGVRACLSQDCGNTWDMDNEIIIRMDGGTPDGQARRVGNGDLGYPVSVQLKDGRIFSVYYFNKNGSNAFMAGTFWELPGR